MYSKKNSKKYLSLAATALGVTIFGACTNVNHKVNFTAYWNEDINVVQSTINETLEYDVAFEKGSGLNDNYSVDYTNGVYVTKLTTEATENGQFHYVYETSLEIDVTYHYKGESAVLHDSVKTLVKFDKAENFLRPISSHKELISSSPLYGSDITSLESCYRTFDYVIDTSYETDDTKGVCVITDKTNTDGEPTENDFEINTEKYTYLDNEQLLFAVRGINPTVSASSKFSVYSPFSDSVQTVGVSFTNVQGADFELTKNGEAGKFELQYYPVSIALNAKNSGATQTAWYAKNTGNSNPFHNVMLRLETPISYNLGKLIYTLKSATFEK